MVKNNKSKIVIMILAIIILAMGGFVVYDKFIKEEPKETDKTEKTENKDNNQEKEPEKEPEKELEKNEIIKPTSNPNYELYKEENEAISLNNEKHELTVFIYKEKAENNMTKWTREIYFDDKLIDTVVDVNRNEDYSWLADKNKAKKISDTDSSDEYSVIEIYKHSGDDAIYSYNVYIVNKKGDLVIKETFEGMGIGIIKLCYNSKAEAGDRNVKQTGDGYCAYEEDYKIDIHSNYFYLIKDSNNGSVITEYKYTISNGTAKSTVEKTYMYNESTNSYGDEVKIAGTSF